MKDGATARLGLLVASDALTGSLIRSGQRGNKKRRKIR